MILFPWIAVMLFGGLAVRKTDGQSRPIFAWSLDKAEHRVAMLRKSRSDHRTAAELEAAACLILIPRRPRPHPVHEYEEFKRETMGAFVPFGPVPDSLPHHWRKA